MDILIPQVGIDVAKDWLDVSVSAGKVRRIASDEAAIQALAASLPKGAIVHMESSGGFERTPERVLRESGIQVRVHDALRSKCLFRARSSRAKTDALDAVNLAKLGSLLPESKGKRSLEHRGLTDHSRCIDRLVKESAKFKLRAGLRELDPAAARAYHFASASLLAQAHALEKSFLKRVKDSSFWERFRLALTVPGVGKVLARVAICELPEDLSSLTPSQICSYAGLAPIDASSGKKSGKSRLCRGNARLKGALYMPAVSCLGSRAWARDHYARLRSRGRNHPQAIVAVMRRLLLQLVAVLKRGSPWQDEPHRT